jgi:hypothetical protein
MARVLSGVGGLLAGFGYVRTFKKAKESKETKPMTMKVSDLD